MVSDEEKLRRRQRLAELAAGIRADLTEIRLADRIAGSRLLPMTRRSFEEDLAQHEAEWDAEEADKT